MITTFASRKAILCDGSAFVQLVEEFGMPFRIKLPSLVSNLYGQGQHPARVSARPLKFFSSSSKLEMVRDGCHI